MVGIRSSTLRNKIEALLAQADIVLDGERPWDMRVHNEAVFDRIVAHGSLGLGESYMEGWWECERLDQFFERALAARLDTQLHSLEYLMAAVKAILINQQTRGRALEVAQRHYDLGNDFYQRMLDPRMQYTCAYWRTANTLAEAQEAKLELICRKLNLRAGEQVLELGCGWGGFARYAAETRGVRVVAYNISEQQVAYARQYCQGLPVEIHLADYRDVTGEYDKVAAIGLMEHIGYKNYAAFIRLVADCLKPGGLFLLHTIGSNVSRTHSDPWISRYIFPNSMLPSVKQIGAAIDGKLVMEDWHNFGPDYDRTLMAWHENFERHWPEFAERYGDQFYRMWRYYLLSCAGAFRARTIQLWQVVLSKGGVPGGYQSVR